MRLSCGFYGVLIVIYVVGARTFDTGDTGIGKNRCKIYEAKCKLSWCSAGKESACIVGDLSLIPVLGRSPGGGHGNPLQYSCLENPHEQRGLVGYSPWDHKELDTTEQ